MSISVVAFKTKQPTDTNSKMKALFVYQFTQKIEWPEEYKKGDFVIGILGETNVSQKILEVCPTKKISNQNLDLKSISTADEAAKCHLVYVTESKKAMLGAILAKIGDNSTLVVTESPGLARSGAGINFVIVDNRLKYELNKKQVEKNNLKVAVQLEQLGILIN